MKRKAEEHAGPHIEFLCEGWPPGRPPSSTCPLVARESTARIAAEAANRARDEFFLTLSHELRGPLSAIANWVHLLRTGKLDEATAARALEAIDQNVTAQAQLIGDMVDVSMVIGAKIRLALRRLNLASLVAETVEAVRPAADAAGLHVQIDAPRPIDMVGDPDRLRQVMQNLLLNAIKFTAKGGQITVRLGCDAREATIAVCDTGQGIRTDFLPHVFERFRQSDAPVTQLGGLGLGLTIVKNLVELHGGTVDATSQGLGKGATFTVTLPTNLAGYEAAPA